MSDQKGGAGAHTEATRDPGQLGTAALGRERLRLAVDQAFLPRGLTPFGPA